MSKRKLRRWDVADRRANQSPPKHLGRKAGRLRWFRIGDLRRAATDGESHDDDR